MRVNSLLTDLRLQGQIFCRDGLAIFAAGAFTAAVQTLLVRETLAVVSGNELVIGIMLAFWLAATAFGSVLGGRIQLRSLNGVLCCMLLLSFSGLTGIRALRLLLMPGETPTPQVLLPMLVVCEMPVAAAGGYVFGALSQRNAGAYIYRWEQAGTLAGLLALSLAIMAFTPNYLIAAGAGLFIVAALKGASWRLAAALLLVFVVLSDRPTAKWKYPLPVDRIRYAREGEVAEAKADGQRMIFVNGAFHSITCATPSVEQAVHTPLGMLPRVRKVLIINSAGHLQEARKYRGAEVRCIRTDWLIDDSSCPCGSLEHVKRSGPFDAVVLGAGMPDNAAASRFFTRTFFARMRTLTGDSGVFSLTLPFLAEYAERRQELMRDIIVSTLMSVYRYVKILPAEGFTFVASDIDYPLPDTCRVENDYYEDLILAGLTPERIEAANRPPRKRHIHTAARPRLLLASLDRYMEQFKVERWMFIALPPILVLLLLPAVRWSMEAVSVGTSGWCAGVYSVAVILLYQSIYGTVYAHLALLLFALSAGFAAGCFVRRFPGSDFVIGTVLGGSLLVMSLLEAPPVALFFIGNTAAGFLASAQFVTRTKTPAGVLYAADCMGGVLGMALASTVLIPLFSASSTAAGMIAIKAAAGVAAEFQRRR